MDLDYKQSNQGLKCLLTHICCSNIYSGAGTISFVKYFYMHLIFFLCFFIFQTTWSQVSVHSVCLYDIYLFWSKF